MEAEFAAGKNKTAVLWGTVLDSMNAVNPEVKDSKRLFRVFHLLGSIRL